MNVKNPQYRTLESLMWLALDDIDRLDVVEGGSIEITVIVNRINKMLGFIDLLRRGDGVTEPELAELALTADDYFTSQGELNPKVKKQFKDILNSAITYYAKNPAVALSIFDAYLAKMQLPAGVRHQVDKKISAKNRTGAGDQTKSKGDKMNYGGIQVTVNSSKPDAAQISLSAPPIHKFNAKSATYKARLGQLLEGLSDGTSRLFYGVMRYFWYNDKIDPDVKRYLAERYTKQSSNPGAIYAIANKQGQIIRAVPDNVDVEGRGARGVTNKQLERVGMLGAPPADIAIRTWIQSKNIGHAQSIEATFRYHYVNL